MPKDFPEEYTDEQARRIQGIVPNFPLTRFNIMVDGPWQANEVVSAAKNIGFVDPSLDLRYNLAVITCSIENTSLFEKRLWDIKGLTFIKAPCPAFNEDGAQVEVRDIVDGKMIITAPDGKADSVELKHVVYDATLGHYVLMKSEERKKKDEELRLRAAKSIADRSQPDAGRFDLI